MHIFHKWSKWSKAEKINVEMVTVIDGIKIGDPYLITKYKQTRTCEKCGKLKNRYINSYGEN